MQVKGSYLGNGKENRSTIHLGALVVPFPLFCFGDPLLKLNSRKKGTLIIMGLLGNLFIGFIGLRVKGPPSHLLSSRQSQGTTLPSLDSVPWGLPEPQKYVTLLFLGVLGYHFTYFCGLGRV